MKKKLSVFEASSIITGYGVGSGCLAMPYIINKCGLPIGIFVIVIAFIFSYVLHLMLADIVIKKGETEEAIGTFSNCLKNNKFKKPLTVILFILLAIVLYSNLAMYITGVADILVNIFGGNSWVYKLVFYSLASLVGIFELKILGICEKYAVIIIFVIETILVIGSLFNIRNSLPIDIENIRSVLSFFSLAMFGFIAFFSVPQVVIGLDKDSKKIKKSIFAGMLMNSLIMLLVIISSLIASDTITEIAIIGLGNGIGLWAKILSSIFTFFAMLTSYWAISVSLKDMFAKNLKINKVLALFIATIPSLLIALIPFASFLSFLEITSGAIALLVVIFAIPLFHKFRKENGSILGKFAVVPLEIVIMLACIFMAVGSLL